MTLLPDDFWDDFENEGGWPHFILAGLVFLVLLLIVPLFIFVLAPQ